MFAKVSCKTIPLLGKDKDDFPYLCFDSIWKQCFARFVCVVVRSSIAYLSLTLMKTATLPILFSLLATSLTHHALLFTSLISASDPSTLFPFPSFPLFDLVC
ncbi:hypothetical protein Fmac_031220 [Flemingia macrophylla]|uniref:Uncharacterized protein n=1 Tax=Flemingia macrophylla TaxID=520843 RepID=A0ABD1L1G6_9FABA